MSICLQLDIASTYKSLNKLLCFSYGTHVSNAAIYPLRFCYDAAREVKYFPILLLLHPSAAPRQLRYQHNDLQRIKNGCHFYAAITFEEIVGTLLSVLDANTTRVECAPLLENITGPRLTDIAECHVFLSPFTPLYDSILFRFANYFFTFYA